MNTLRPCSPEASEKSDPTIAAIRHPLAHRFRRPKQGRPRLAKPRRRRPCVVPLELAELIRQHHPELLDVEAALLLFVAYCVSCWAGQDPMPAPRYFLRDLHARSRTAAEVVEHCREAFGRSRVGFRVTDPAYWDGQARQVHLDPHPAIRSLLDPAGWEVLKTEPQVDLLNPRRKPGSKADQRRAALEERRDAEASVEECPDPLRKERLKRFVQTPSMRRQLNEILRYEEELGDLLSELPREGREHNRAVLARLQQMSFYRPAEPRRRKQSCRIGARMSIGDLTKSVRRWMFPHDLEVDGRSMWLSFAPYVVGAPGAAKIVGDWLAAGLDPWMELTKHCLDGAIPEGDDEAIDEARKHIKLLGQMVLCGAYTMFPKRKIRQYSTPDIGRRLREHPVMAEIIARRDEIFDLAWETGEATFADGQSLTLNLSRQPTPEQAVKVLRSQLAAAIDRYECEAILGCYREVDRLNAGRERPRFRVRYDTHDGFAFYRDDWRCPYRAEIDQILRAGEQLVADRYGITMRFRLAHDPRDCEAETLRMQREVRGACRVGLGKQLGAVGRYANA